MYAWLVLLTGLSWLVCCRSARRLRGGRSACVTGCSWSRWLQPSARPLHDRGARAGLPAGATRPQAVTHSVVADDPARRDRWRCIPGSAATWTTGPITRCLAMRSATCWRCRSSTSAATAWCCSAVPGDRRGGLVARGEPDGDRDGSASTNLAESLILIMWAAVPPALDVSLLVPRPADLRAVALPSLQRTGLPDPAGARPDEAAPPAPLAARRRGAVACLSRSGHAYSPTLKADWRGLAGWLNRSASRRQLKMRSPSWSIPATLAFPANSSKRPATTSPPRFRVVAAALDRREPTVRDLRRLLPHATARDTR